MNDEENDEENAGFWGRPANREEAQADSIKG